MKYFNILIGLFLFGVSCNSALAQVSAGGVPVNLPKLKSLSLQNKIVELPKVDVAHYLFQKNSNVLEKSVTYACPITVALNTANDGIWFQQDDLRIWQLHLKSEGALSLGLVFSKYHLPPGARLFITNTDGEMVYGAFTDANNKPYRKLAIYPFPGEELLVQYEEPLGASFEGELEIGTVYHDFLGVVSLKNRWKQRTSSYCNVDINCENHSGLNNEQRAVCRIFAGGELGTGTLLNNTKRDGQPLLLSAHHVYHKEKEPNRTLKSIAEITLFDFNYERPFCVPIDGSDFQSVSGATLLAAFDSLDFVLVELNEMPPPSYRPFFAGWDATGTIPAGAYTIHHPNGDVKKITHDEGTCDSLSFSSSFLRHGHWKVFNWESGTTESGSSGSALFGQNNRVFGTLSGGAASCKIIDYDAFARLDKMWKYRSESNQQLAVWLDPEGKGVRSMDGYDPYETEEIHCTLISNYMTEDVLTNTVELQQKSAATEFAEQFSQVEEATLAGISIGIHSFFIHSQWPELTIRIYSGDHLPEVLEKIYRFPMKGLTARAMNYFSFDDPVSVGNNFFVTISSNDPLDSMIFYQSDYRGVVGTSSMLIRNREGWKYAADYRDDKQGASMLMQLNICASSFKQDVDSLPSNSQLMKFYPNPARQYLVVEFLKREQSNELSLSNLLGQKLYTGSFKSRSYAEIDVADLVPGIYLLSIRNNGQQETRRVLIF